MRKFIALFLFFFLISSCDDGDATVEQVTFDESAVNVCGQLYYKITDNQAIIINLPANNTLFQNDPTSPDSPRTLAVGSGGASVYYRIYNDAVTQQSFCSNPPPITPVATTEWIASAGTVAVSTTAIYETPDPLTGRSRISQYRHSIVISGLSFVKPDGTTQNYTNYVVGNYVVNVTDQLNFSFGDNPLQLCPAGTIIYNALNGGAEGLSLENFDPALLDSSILNTPKTGLIGDAQNVLIYRQLASGIGSGGNQDYFCAGGTNPAVRQEWRGVAGVANVSGIIEVVTSGQAGNYVHDIRLKNVTFKKTGGNSTFFYGYDIPYGQLLTTN